MSKKNFYISFLAAVFSLGLIIASSHGSFLARFSHLKTAFAQSTNSVNEGSSPDSVVQTDPSQNQSQNQNTVLSGFGWSSNIGWISMLGTSTANTPFAVNVNGSVVSGYAWSSNIGWLSFQPSDVSAAGCGSPVTYNNGVFSGNAVFLSGSGRTDGWDGCVGFKGNALDGSPYGVTSSGTNLAGYAWGSNVVGWIDMSGVVFGTSGNTLCLDGSAPIGGICPAACTPGTQTCSGGLMCSPAGTCPSKCPDGSTLPSSGSCTVASAQNNFSASGQCSSTSTVSVSLVLNAPNAQNGTYTINKGGTIVKSGTLDSSGHVNFVDASNIAPSSSYQYVATVKNLNQSQTVTLPASGTVSAATPSLASCQQSQSVNSAGKLTASPPLVAQGGICTLTWKDVDVTNYTCNLVSTDGSGESYPVSASNDSKAITNLQKTSRYQVQCSAPGKSTLSSNAATCNVGSIREF